MSLTALTTGFEPGDIIWVPFPFVETQEIRSRPALVISAQPLGPDLDLLWVLMITNASRPSWPGDVIIVDHTAVGLPIPSKIRTEKISTVISSGSEKMGKIGAVALSDVQTRVLSYLKG